VHRALRDFARHAEQLKSEEAFVADQDDQEDRDPESEAPSRRQFLGQAGLTTVTLAAGTLLSEAAFADDETEDGRGGNGGGGGDRRAAEARSRQAEQIRIRAARNERQLGGFIHPSNGDEQRYASKIGNFSKTMRHNDLGEVNAADYAALVAAIERKDFAGINAIPTDGGTAFANPLGGHTFNMEGPDSAAIPVAAPPALASPQFAYQMAEIYWMAVCRDVPFSEYETSPLIRACIDDLSTRFSGYFGPANLSPQSLFRADYPGVTTGPMLSQFLLANFTYDGITIGAQTRAAVPAYNPGDTGYDFLTYRQEFINAERGFPQTTPAGSSIGPLPIFPTRPPAFTQQFLSDPRFPFSVRQLGQVAGQDNIFSIYYRAQLICNALKINDLPLPLNDGNPYKGNTRQSGFASWGGGQQADTIGAIGKAERHAWWTKWNVNRYLRPEAGAGRVHNTANGLASYPIHSDLFAANVLEQVARINDINNRRRGVSPLESTNYYLPQMFSNGSPSHPSFTAGHAITAGACITFIKSWFNTADLSLTFPNPMQPTADGKGLVAYRGTPLTIEGELNKLCVNISLGRDMSGVHWRSDDLQGNIQGEELAIRTLREARPTYPEPLAKPITFRRFNGSTVTI
jgi:hypothetical protein